MRRQYHPRLYLASGLSCIGGLLFGYDTGVINGALPLLIEDFNLSTVAQSLTVSVTVALAIVGGLLAGPLNKRYGRKAVTLFSSLVFTIGAVLLAISPDFLFLLVGRAVVGFGVGLASATCPVYTSELAPVELRGLLTSGFILCCTFGQFLACVICALFATADPLKGWRWMFGVSGIPSIIQGLGFLFMPESPRWLALQGRLEEAKQSLKAIRTEQDVLDGSLDSELETISKNMEENSNLIQTTTETTVANENGEMRYPSNGQTTNPPRNDGNTPSSSMWQQLKSLFAEKSTRNALIVGCGLQAIQQFSGINTVMYYSSLIIGMSGISANSQGASSSPSSRASSNVNDIWIASVVASANFIGTIVGLFLIKYVKMGRRSLTLGSLLGTTLALCFLATCFLLQDQLSNRVDFDPAAGTGVSGFNPQPWVSFAHNVTGLNNYTASNFSSAIVSDPCFQYLAQKYTQAPAGCYDCVFAVPETLQAHQVCGMCKIPTTTSGSSGISTPPPPICIAGTRNGEALNPIFAPFCSTHPTTPTTVLTTAASSWYTGSCPSAIKNGTGIATIIALIFYLLCFAPGMGPMPWTINAEIYPTESRSLCSGLATVTNWVTNLIVSAGFLFLVRILQPHGAFLVIAGCALGGLLFLYLYLPETRGVPLEDIPSLFLYAKRGHGTRPGERRGTYSYAPLSQPQSEDQQNNRTGSNNVSSKLSLRKKSGSEDARTTTSRYVERNGVKVLVPTSEWQEIPQGWACPPGLEFRMDFETGRNYARLNKT
eukprot:g3530.t1